MIGFPSRREDLLARDAAITKVLDVLHSRDDYLDRLYASGHPLLADALVELARVHEDGGRAR